MRRSAWIFVAAILLPSLVLAWLAVRSARDQQVILEHQQTIISQNITDVLAKRIQEQVDSSRSGFVLTTQQLLKKSSSPLVLAQNFNSQLRGVWDLAEIGFAVDQSGLIESPKPYESSMAKTFRAENDRFLGNREPAQVFSLSSESQSQQQALLNSQSQNAGNDNSRAQILSPANQSNQMAVNQMAQIQRQVLPQKYVGTKQNTFSNTLSEESDFRRVMGGESSGQIARFLENKLRLMVWYRPPNARSLVFGAQILEHKLIENLRPLLQSPADENSTDIGIASPSYCVAILDDRGKPVLLSKTGFTTDWRHPFVATEIGESLPHWEAALYLVDPREINRSASTLQLTVGSMVTVLIAAILLGGWFMAADARRQMRLAQQKTDFVSNVSHELKTPLTSIRMFADMLAEGRAPEPERQANYLRIISAESARLTRLINNVLDFARMERGAPSGERRPCNLVEVVLEVLNACRPHLETVNVALAVQIHAETLPVMGDRDALAQILLNLLSNAEKYGGQEILVAVRRQELALGSSRSAARPSADSGSACVEVLDRGPGIHAKKKEAIFEPFRRLDNSLSSGVSGSGLGLTLARRMARDHGGDVTYSPRSGGGSCFTLTIPLTFQPEADKDAS